MKSITTIHHNLPTNVAKQIVKSVIGSLNATAIAYARGHLRFNAIENIADRKGDEVPTIDDYNDAHNAIDESTLRNTVVADGMGFEIQMQAGELAECMMRLRNWFAAWLEQHKALNNDNALSISETIKFQMSRPSTTNDDMLEALALAVDIDVDLLKAAQLKMVTDDAADLKQNAGKVLTYLEAFEQYDTDGAGHMVPVSDDDEILIESMFDGMPAHVQFKLMNAAVRAHDKAQQKALQALLRGKLDAAADIKMLKGSREELVAWLGTFTIAKRVQLDAYLDRGGVLPMLEDRTIVGAEQKAPAAPAAATKPQMKRAPRPTAA